MLMDEPTNIVSYRVAYHATKNRKKKTFEKRKKNSADMEYVSVFEKKHTVLKKNYFGSVLGFVLCHFLSKIILFP